MENERLEVRLRDVPEIVKETIKKITKSDYLTQRRIYVERTDNLEGPHHQPLYYIITLGKEDDSFTAPYITSSKTGAALTTTHPQIWLHQQKNRMNISINNGGFTGICASVKNEDFENIVYEKRKECEILTSPVTEPPGYQLMIRKEDLMEMF